MTPPHIRARGEVRSTSARRHRAAGGAGTGAGRAARPPCGVRPSVPLAARPARRRCAARGAAGDPDPPARRDARRSPMLRCCWPVHAGPAGHVPRGPCAQARPAAGGRAAGSRHRKPRLHHAARCRAASGRRTRDASRSPRGAARRLLCGRGSLRVSTRRLRTEDGVELALHRLRAHRDRRAAALLVHGAFSSHTAWLQAGGGLAHFLGERGFDVWLADQRHHGGSAREPRPFAWRFEDLILGDAPALVARVMEETDGAPLAWVGHSAGGAVGLAWLARLGRAAPLAAMVTLGTPGPSGMRLARRTLALGAIAICHVLGRFPARALRMGSEDEAALVLGDWMSWNTEGRWVGRDGFDYLAALAAVRTPYLGVAAKDDSLFAPADACRHVVSAVGAARKALLLVPHLDHRGMLLDPRARDSCWPQVSDWLEETLRT